MKEERGSEPAIPVPFSCKSIREVALLVLAARIPCSRGFCNLFVGEKVK